MDYGDDYDDYEEEEYEEEDEGEGTIMPLEIEEGGSYPTPPSVPSSSTSTSAQNQEGDQERYLAQLRDQYNKIAAEIKRIKPNIHGKGSKKKGGIGGNMATTTRKPVGTDLVHSLLRNFYRESERIQKQINIRNTEGKKSTQTLMNLLNRLNSFMNEVISEFIQEFRSPWIPDPETAKNPPPRKKKTSSGSDASTTSAEMNNPSSLTPPAPPNCPPLHPSRHSRHPSHPSHPPHPPHPPRATMATEASHKQRKQRKN